MHKPGGTAPRLNPRKLLLSKWTAAQPQNKEKHFLVTELLFDDDEQQVIGIALQAVMTGSVQQLPWQALQDPAHWRIGWK